ncbi:MAG: SMP-30/gluconolactonase/LRE family protein [Chloroflexi bacterium]|nr:SMP-30/gluconolactonase/LRE family protein [Chloroflexota bacterium]
MTDVEHVLAVNCELGEGPIWNVQEQKLYWVDILQNTIHTYQPERQIHQAIEFEDHVCAMGFRKKGGMVLATRKHFAMWDDDLQTVEELEFDLKDNRFNDGAVDRQGRFWAGTMNPSSPTGSLYRLNHDLTVEKMVTGVTISNGIGWSPDNTTMYFTDSPLCVIYAYDFDPPTGSISNKRVFIQIGDAGVPDGLTVDSEGYIWSARYGGAKVVRYSPDGKFDREIALPVEKVTSVALGGPDLTDLYITSAWEGYTEVEIQENPMAGDLFRAVVEVPGLPEPYFLG